MFGSKSASKSLLKGSTTLIAAGTQVQGKVKICGSLEIEGVVNGDIVMAENCDCAEVWVHSHGQVNGDIKVPTVVINGLVEGNVFSSKRVELASKAVVKGDVHYQIIEMMKGSQVNGNLLYESKTSDI